MLESHRLQICPYYDPRVVIYDHKMFIRLATGKDDTIQQLRGSLQRCVKHTEMIFSIRVVDNQPLAVSKGDTGEMIKKWIIPFR